MSLTGATPTEASKASAVSAEAVPYVPLHIFDSHDGKLLVIQTGHYNCAGNEHRAFLITTAGLVLPGCADIKDDVIDVKLETGVTIHLPFKSTLS